ncbi:MAG: hypothetical protein ABFD96_21450, partial [Armatimonadia bacterium]
MCRFFSCVYHRDRGVLFTHTNSHEDILAAAGLEDTTINNRPFVRIEAVPVGDGFGYRVDETGSLPDWYDESRVRPIVLTTAAQVRQAEEAYQATVRPAKEVYQATVRPAEEAYQATVRPAEEVYQATVRPAEEAYQATVRP